MRHPSIKGVRRRGKVWWFDSSVGGVKITKSLETSDPDVAAERAILLRAEARRRASGDAPRPSGAQEVIGLIEAYQSDLNRRGLTPKHVREVIRSLIRLSAGAGVETIAGWTPAATERALATRSGRSSRTRNKSLDHVRSFGRWLRKTGRWDRDLAAGVEKVRSQRQRERRSLTPAELGALLESSPGPRALVYRVAAYTGLRRSEIGRLRPEHVDLVRGEINLPGEETKNRKTATLPVPPGLVDAWRAWLEDPWWRGPHGRVEAPETAVLPPLPNLKTFYRDLDRAGVERETSSGLVDFHSLRVTYITNLARAGVPLATAVRLARHSDPRLTAAIYTRFAPVELADAARLMEELTEDRASDNLPTSAFDSRRETA